MTALGVGLAPTRARIQAANTANLTLVKAGAGSLVSLVVANNAATIAYVRIYDINHVPVVANDVPIATLILSGSGTGGAGGFPYTFAPPAPLPFVNGLAYNITAAAGDSDATAVAAGQVSGELSYYTVNN